MKEQFGYTAPLQTAVLLLVFNRPDKTAQVFEAIRQVKPSRLYVAADGPRPGRNEEAENVARVREIAISVDWPCEVKTLFRDENLGCKHAVSSAITWFFENEEQGIILEDDCVAHPDFFYFCDELLDRYANDERIAVVTGNNFQNGQWHGDASYFFSKYNHCWGWATWRRAWKHYQGDIPFWPEWKSSKNWIQKKPDRTERAYWRSIFDSVFAGEIDSWAYPWTACVWYYGALTATPNVNLVSNIGYGSDATHTTSVRSELSEIPIHSIGELRHPKYIEQDLEADLYTFNHRYKGKFRRWPSRLLRLPKRALVYILRIIKQAVPSYRF